jgi:hypothetical protein
MRLLLLPLLLLLAACPGTPGCLRAEDCKSACGDRGVRYFGPTRGAGGFSECICAGAPLPEEQR